MCQFDAVFRQLLVEQCGVFVAADDISAGADGQFEMSVEFV